MIALSTHVDSIAEAQWLHCQWHIIPTMIVNVVTRSVTLNYPWFDPLYIVGTWWPMRTPGFLDEENLTGKKLDASNHGLCGG